MRTLITADAHIGVPWSLVDELPARFRDMVPHLERSDDGLELVRPKAPDWAMASMLPTRTAVDERDLARHAVVNVKDSANPGFTPEERLAEMARDGVSGEVLITLQEDVGLGRVLHPELEVAFCELFNDWLADTYQHHYDQFAPGAILPRHSPEAAAAELVRAAGRGLRPALLPDVMYDRPYNDPSWEPLWEAAEGCDMPIAFHVGGARTVGHGHHAGGAQADFAFVAAGMVETVGWFVGAGILARHPGLTIVCTECGAGWLGWAMSHFDYVQKSEFSSRPDWVPLDDLPSEYVKRQVKATFMEDPVAVAMRDFTGVDCLMWGSDYPHREGQFPHSQEAVATMFAGVPEADVDRIVHQNAADIYRLAV